jgi:hypothetical protein
MGQEAALSGIVKVRTGARLKSKQEAIPKGGRDSGHIAHIESRSAHNRLTLGPSAHERDP